MAIQKFALYDLIVDIIPGAILLVVLYSVAPIGLYQHFFGISPSLVPGIAVILFSYPVGRIVVHGISSKVENHLLSLYTQPIYNLKKWLKTNPGAKPEKRSEESTEEQPEDDPENEVNSIRKQDVDQDNSIESWFDDAESTPSDVSSSVVHDVHSGLVSIIGPDADAEALRRYGENVLFSRKTLYGKYEILSTFYRHMTFISILAFLIYLAYLPIHEARLPPQFTVQGSAPISDWPLFLLFALPLLTLSAVYLCLWRWKDWTESRNRAFVNDLHTYLREQDLGVSNETEN
jgi:hypothetical protein